MDQPIVGNPGDPFATVAAAPPGSPPSASAAPGSPPAGTTPAPFSITQEQWDAQQAETARLKKLEQNVGWIGEALGDPAVRSRVMGLLAAGAAPNVTPAPQVVVDPAEAIAPKYTARMQEALANGDMVAYGRANAEMGAEIAEARISARPASAASGLGGTVAQNAIDNWFANKRLDPRTSEIFPKLEPKLRALIAQTHPSYLTKMVEDGSLLPSLEGAFAKIFTDSYIEGYSEAKAQGKLASTAPQKPPPYAMGARGGAPQYNRGDALPDESEEESQDDKSFLEMMSKSFPKGFSIKGNKNGTTLVSEID